MSETQTDDLNKDKSEESTGSSADVPSQAPEKTFQDLLGNITNEQGEQKYQSVEDALKGSAHAQSYIMQLKQQMQEMADEHEQLKEELAKRKGFEQVLDTISSKGKKEDTTSGNTDEQNVDFDALIEQKLQAREQANRAKANKQGVYDSLQEVYGGLEQAVDAFKGKAAELGLTVTELQGLAERSPKAVLAYFNAPDKKVNINSSVKGDALPPKKEDKGPTPRIMNGAKRSDVLALWKSCRPEE